MGDKTETKGKQIMSEEEKREPDENTVRMEIPVNEVFQKAIQIVPGKRTQIIIAKPKQEISE